MVVCLTDCCVGDCTAIARVSATHLVSHLGLLLLRLGTIAELRVTDFESCLECVGALRLSISYSPLVHTCACFHALFFCTATSPTRRDLDITATDRTHLGIVTDRDTPVQVE